MQSFSISDRGRARLHRSNRDRRPWSPAEFLDIEGRLAGYGLKRIAGVDEAGRGPLAGPVVAAAVVLRPDDVPVGIRDSKKLTPKLRKYLCEEIRRRALAVGVGIVPAVAIDRVNILQASIWAMSEALESLNAGCDCAIVDGRALPDMDVPTIGIIKGDARCVSVAAASIVAKVTRDRLMDRMHLLFPRYSFRSNKGYGTKEHLKALRKHGPSRIHRFSFEPVLSTVEGRV